MLIGIFSLNVISGTEDNESPRTLRKYRKNFRRQVIAAFEMLNENCQKTMKSKSTFFSWLNCWLISSPLLCSSSLELVSSTSVGNYINIVCYNIYAHTCVLYILL